MVLPAMHTPLPTLTAAALLLAWTSGCFVPELDLAGKACDDQHPCPMSLLCIGGVCVGASGMDAAAAIPPDATAVADAGSTDAAQAPIPDASLTGPDASAPDLDASAPDLDASAPDLDASAPDLDASAPDLDASAPGLDASAPGLDASAPGLDASAPGLDASAPGLDASMAQLIFHRELDVDLGDAGVAAGVTAEFASPPNGLARTALKLSEQSMAGPGNSGIHWDLSSLGPVFGASGTLAFTFVPTFSSSAFAAATWKIGLLTCNDNVEWLMTSAFSGQPRMLRLTDSASNNQSLISGAWEANDTIVAVVRWTGSDVEVLAIRNGVWLPSFSRSTFSGFSVTSGRLKANYQRVLTTGGDSTYFMYDLRVYDGWISDEELRTYVSKNTPRRHLVYEEGFESGTSAADWSLSVNGDPANLLLAMESGRAREGNRALHERLAVDGTGSPEYRAEVNLVPVNPSKELRFNTEYWLGVSVHPGARPAVPLAESVYYFGVHINRSSTGAWTQPPIRIGTNGDRWSVRLEAGDASATGSPAPVPRADEFAGIAPVAYDQWNDFVVHFKLSDGSQDGFCQVWINQRWINDDDVVSSPMVDYHGPLGYGGDAPFYKQGLYVPSWSPSGPAGTTLEAWHDAFRIGSDLATYPDVAPAP
ncbi:MAG: heparin lyase I family protein [Deltaproteobacteria bacterium]|nr:heparin lyase I family protein [Deltaproteobacteria bacterium]